MVIVSLASAEDDSEVTSGWHKTGTDPLPHERRTLAAARINLQSVPHEQEDYECFEFPEHKMPGEFNPVNQTFSDTEIDQFTHLPPHIATPPPQGIEWFGTNFPFLVCFFSSMYLLGSYSQAFSWISSSK